MNKPKPASKAPAGIAAALLAGTLAAVGIIKPWEGKRNVGYADVVGIPTDCYGNTHGARIGVYRTDAECEAMLDAEVRSLVDQLSVCIRVPLTPNQAGAVLSWAYNVGPSAACNSSLVRKVNAGQPADVWCDELLRWDYAGGKRIRGLTNRRVAEHKVCEGLQ